MKLSAWLKHHNKTSREFADEIGVSEIAVKRYRAGGRVPQPAIMAKILAATEGAVTANDFHLETEGAA